MIFNGVYIKSSAIDSMEYVSDCQDTGRALISTYKKTHEITCEKEQFQDWVRQIEKEVRK